MAFPQDSTRIFPPLRLWLSDTALFPFANVEAQTLNVYLISSSVDVYVPTVLSHTLNRNPVRIFSFSIICTFPFLPATPFRFYIFHFLFSPPRILYFPLSCYLKFLFLFLYVPFSILFIYFPCYSSALPTPYLLLAYLHLSHFCFYPFVPLPMFFVSFFTSFIAATLTLLLLFYSFRSLFSSPSFPTFPASVPQSPWLSGVK